MVNTGLGLLSSRLIYPQSWLNLFIQCSIPNASLKCVLPSTGEALLLNKLRRVNVFVQVSGTIFDVLLYFSDVSVPLKFDCDV